MPFLQPSVSSFFFCSYVYLDARTFSRTFAKKMADIEMSSVSSTHSDDSDGGSEIALTGVSFGENIGKLMAEHFYRR